MKLAVFLARAMVDLDPVDHLSLNGVNHKLIWVAMGKKHRNLLVKTRPAATTQVLRILTMLTVVITTLIAMKRKKMHGYVITTNDVVT